MSLLASLGLGVAGLAGSALGGLFGRKKETKNEAINRELIDQLLASLKGKGPYKDLFNMDDAAFQKSYVEPAKHTFNSQIAPQIQQQYIASGQQRGTGLDDSLIRAGVDLDQILNQAYAGMKENSMNRQSGLIGNVLGRPSVQDPQSKAQGIGQGIAGYFGGSGFTNTLDNAIRSSYRKKGFDTDIGG